MDGLTRSEPARSVACCAGPDLYRPIGKFRVHGRIYKRKFNVPFRAEHGPPHSLTSSGRAAAARKPPPPGANIERRSVSNPGSHYRESSTLPTELRGGQSSHRPRTVIIVPSFRFRPIPVVSTLSSRLKVVLRKSISWKI